MEVLSELLPMTERKPTLIDGYGPSPIPYILFLFNSIDYKIVIQEVLQQFTSLYDAMVKQHLYTLSFARLALYSIFMCEKCEI